MASIIDARAQFADQLSPSLRRDIDETLASLYTAARKQAVVELQDYGEHDAALSLRVECPYTVDRILADDWYPSPAEPPDERSRDAPSGEAK